MQQINAATEQGILTPAQLAAQVRRLIETPADWVTRIRLDPEGRWYEQIPVSDLCELWLISWLPGQSTGFHDHGGANGAFGVVWGQLEEHLVPRRGASPPARLVTAGRVRSFGQHHVHDVRNSSANFVAVSVHAYSPPLSAMTRYDLTPGGPVPIRTEGADEW